MEGPGAADPSAAVLQMLERAGTRYLSGTHLGATLGLSRAAVWKRVEALRADGYAIEARPRAGYRLRGRPDILTPARVGNDLAVRRIGREIRHVLDVPSTMTVAGEAAAAGAPDGTVIVAERQTQGRGRLGREWHSAPGRGIWMTIVLRPPMSPMELAPLTLLAAVGVAAGIEAATGLAPGIKWPNDVLLNDRKVCGILTELLAEQDAVRYVLVGIGINVHQTPDEFPGEVRHLATSLAVAAGHAVDRVAVVRAVLAALDREYDAALRGGFGPVLDRWRARSVTLGREVTVQTAGRTLVGIAEDITAQGGLIVREPAGRRHTVLSGDVTLRNAGG